VLRYKVVENVVSAEEFRRAYCARDAYNYTRNLDISEEEKSLIIEQVISTFSSEEREFYEPTEYGSDLHIINIGKYPNGLYAADILSYHHHTQFLSSDFVPLLIEQSWLMLQPIPVMAYMSDVRSMIVTHVFTLLFIL
jgi:hypothetical protein